MNAATGAAVGHRVEHWAYQAKSPLRDPAEIRELASAPAHADLSEPGEDYLDQGLGFESYDEFDATTEAYEDEYLEEEYLEDEESEHPLAAVFSLPRAAFDAMTKGGWAAAIAIAVGTGQRDPNKLTNMVFWFRHPHLVGQKLRSDQQDLVREWVQIRDGIVRPALAGQTPSPVSAPTVTRYPQGATKVRYRTMIPPDGLRWMGPPAEGTPEVSDFMRRVYLAHVARSDKPGNRFVDTLPRAAIDKVPSGQWARKDAAAAANAMFRAAQAALVEQGLQDKVRIGVRSGYRSADEQFVIWQGRADKGFPHYYAETKAARRRLAGGEFGPAAVSMLADHIAGNVAAPGFSNHQDGLALDLSTSPGARRLVKVYYKSWFHNWLTKNAHHHGFHQPLSNEPWHWVYKPPATASEAEWSEMDWTREAPPTAIAAGRKDVQKLRLLASHQRKGKGPDVVMRWSAMPSVPKEIDVVVHLHGYSGAEAYLVDHYLKWSGLDLTPVDGVTGTGRTRPTLTVLPRGNHTGVKTSSGLYKYTFPALTTKNGLDELVRASLKEFADLVGGAPPNVARLILTAHSGGGAPLMQILRQRRQAPPDEVFVFDGLYQDATALAEWATQRIQADRKAVVGSPLGAMRVFYGCGTNKFSVRLRKAVAGALAGAPASLQARYRVEFSHLEHMQMPRQYGWRMLADPAANVPDALAPSVPPAAIQPEAEIDETWSEAEDLEDNWAGEWEDEWQPGELAGEELELGKYEEPKDERGSEALDENVQEDEHGPGEVDEDEDEVDEDEGYADEGYADQGYADEGYADEGYADEGYADEGYADQAYADQAYDEASGGSAPVSEAASGIAGVPQALMTELAWRGELQESAAAAAGSAVQAGTGQAVSTPTRVEVSVRTDFGVRSGNTLNFDWAHGEAISRARVTVVGTAITAVTNAHGRARLDTTGLRDGIHTVRIEHTVANQNTPDLAGPSVADPLATPPSRIYRPLDVWVTSSGGRFTGAMVAWFGSHGGIGNRDHDRVDGTHLPVDWKPVWMKSPMKTGESPRATNAIDLVVVHTTGGLVIGPAINTFLGTADVQNAHYLIDHDGHVIKFAEDGRRANQTGYSRWKNSTSLNSRSIGIEVMQRSDGFTPLAMQALTALIDRVRAAYPSIPAHRIVGHCDIATSKGNRTLLSNRRLNDPGARFDWTTLERRGLGMRVPGVVAVGTAYGGIFNVAPGQPAMVLRSGDHDPQGTTPARLGGVNRPGLTATPIADIQRDLEHIGYSVRPVGGALGRYDAHTVAAVDRFQRHFFSGTRAGMRPTLGRIDATTAAHINAIRPGVP